LRAILIALFILAALSFLLSHLFFAAATPPDIYTLSLHDALPISPARLAARARLCLPETQAHPPCCRLRAGGVKTSPALGRGPGRSEEPRLNSSHVSISYAVFCLKKKKISTHTRVSSEKGI